MRIVKMKIIKIKVLCLLCVFMLGVPDAWAQNVDVELIARAFGRDEKKTKEAFKKFMQLSRCKTAEIKQLASVNNYASTGILVAYALKTDINAYTFAGCLVSRIGFSVDQTVEQLKKIVNLPFMQNKEKKKEVENFAKGYQQCNRVGGLLQ